MIPTFPRLMILGVVLLSTNANATEEPITFYVATDGNDAWSGRQEAPQDGGKDGPFATVARARDAIRDYKQHHSGRLDRPVNIMIRGGRYELTEPLVFTPEDSGTPDAPITYAAYHDESPVLSGGRRINGWHAGKVNDKDGWIATLPEVRDGQWMFHQLWSGEERRQRARKPNEGFLRIEEVPDLKPDAPYNQGQNRFRYAPGDIQNWKNLEDVDVVVLHFWVGTRLAVKSVDESERLVTFEAPSHRRLKEGHGSNAEAARYFIENAKELVDAPGEWYLDRKSGELSYLPRDGESMESTEIIAPVLPQLVRLEGHPEKGQFIEHLRFQGLQFSHNEQWLKRSNPGDDQASVHVTGAIHGEGLRHSRFDGCTISHVGSYGLELGRGCQENEVRRCNLFDLSAGGVKLGETRIRKDEKEQASKNVLEDCQIHGGGRDYIQAVGVWIGQSAGNRIAHNHIHDFRYTGISVGWTWGYGDTLTRNNIIEANHVHDIGQGWLSDMGGIYTLGVQPGTVIRRNVFHDITAHNYGGWGIYFDEGSSQIVAEGNLVYRTTHGGFHQHYGRDNVFRNNIIALGRDAQIQRTRLEPHRSFTFERNIVFWTQGDLLAGDWKELHADFDHNLYWHANSNEPIRFAGRSWEEWQALGADRHSKIADPKFVAPLEDDFTLPSDSPALDLGFEPLKLSDVGPRER